MTEPKLILTVCRGNIARSPFSEEIIRQELHKRGLEKQFVSISRGVQGTSVDPGDVEFPNITYYPQMFADTQPVLEKYAVDLSNHVSRKMDAEIARKASIILAVDTKTKLALEKLYPTEVDKIHLISELVGKHEDISDPEGLHGPAKQEKVFTELHSIIVNGFEKLLFLIES